MFITVFVGNSQTKLINGKLVTPGVIKNVELLLFAGTTEGGELAEYFSTCNVQVTVCVATEYGQTLIFAAGKSFGLAGRLTQQEMEKKIIGEGYGLVVRCHPSLCAGRDRKNVRAACEKDRRPYFRCCLRQEESAGRICKCFVCRRYQSGSRC